VAKKKTIKKSKAKKAKVSAKSKKTAQPRIPKPREVNVAKMDAQLKRLKERKLVPRSATSLIGVTLVREYHGKKYVVRGTKTGWLVKNSGKRYAGLFGAAASIAGAPRNPYVFFSKSLKNAEIN
jgi:hypothetical protein